jgi:hypothetical protein
MPSGSLLRIEAHRSMTRRAEFSVRLKITTTSCNLIQIIYAILVLYTNADIANPRATYQNTLLNITSLSPSELTLLYERMKKQNLRLH